MYTCLPVAFVGDSWNLYFFATHGGCGGRGEGANILNSVVVGNSGGLWWARRERNTRTLNNRTLKQIRNRMVNYKRKWLYKPLCENYITIKMQDLKMHILAALTKCRKYN